MVGLVVIYHLRPCSCLSRKAVSDSLLDLRTVDSFKPDRVSAMDKEREEDTVRYSCVDASRIGSIDLERESVIPRIKAIDGAFR